MENHLSDEGGGGGSDDREDVDGEGGGGGGEGEEEEGEGRKGRGKGSRKEHRPLTGCASMVTSTENGRRRVEDGRRCSSVKQSQKFAVNDPNAKRGMPNSASLGRLLH